MIKEKILKIVYETIDNDKALNFFENNLDLLNKFNLDSVEIITLLVAIEEKFGIEFGINDDIVEIFSNITTLIKCIEEKQQSIV